MQDILVIGYSTRNIVCSARRTGYNVCSIDAFTDSDLVECAVAAKVFDLGETVDVKDISREKIVELIDGFRVDFDAIVLGSGFEMMDLTDLPCPILNNSPGVMQEVSDKEKLAKKLASMDMPHPHTYHRNNIDPISYPVMVKPKCAGGGIFNRVARDVGELNAYFDEISSMGVGVGVGADVGIGADMGGIGEGVSAGIDRDLGISVDDMLIQEFVSGVPVSVSVISTKQNAVAVTVNEQMIGVPWLTGLPFAYCGNITPYETPYAKKLCGVSEELILKLGLVGSNGVDFMLTDTGPVIIEVNARFQGSMDSVELATGINLFDAHVKAFAGELSQELKTRPVAKQFAARAVVYAKNRVVIDEQAMDGLHKEPVTDIPNIGYLADVNEPVTSILCTEKTREGVMANVKKSVCNIRDIIDK